MRLRRRNLGSRPEGECIRVLEGIGFDLKVEICDGVIRCFLSGSTCHRSNTMLILVLAKSESVVGVQKWVFGQL